jgi:hypothetical protein
MSLPMIAAAAGLGACTRHTVDVQPIRVEPIHLTVDINVRIDRELEDFFEFERRIPPPPPEPFAPDPFPTDPVQDIDPIPSVDPALPGGAS